MRSLVFLKEFYLPLNGLFERGHISDTLQAHDEGRRRVRRQHSEDNHALLVWYYLLASHLLVLLVELVPGLDGIH
jgi:hypothetical protein